MAWRGALRSRARGAAALSAVVLTTAAVAACDEPGSAKLPAAPATDAPDGLRTIAEWDETDGDEPTPVDPGSYRIPASAWSVAGFTVEFPAGWTSQYGHVYGTNSDQPDEVGFYAVTVDRVFNDSCAPEDESTQPVGTGVDDLYVALQEQSGGAMISRPLPSTLGGYPATRFDLEIPKHRDVSACRMAPAGLQIWYSEPADKYFVLLRDAIASVYVVDVGGQRQVFLAQASNAASAADRTALQAVLDSIRIEGASPASELSVTGDGSIYVAADTRGGDALTDPLTFREAELDAQPSDLYLVRRDQPARRVVASFGPDTCPRVSPDGDFLAYLQYSNLVVAPIDASGAPGAPLLRARGPAASFGCPEWSPDGTRLAYLAVTKKSMYLDTPVHAEVRTVGLDGRHRLVTSFQARMWVRPDFAWSPDGKQVAYTTERGLWRVRLGGEPELLWRPAPGDPSQELPMVYDRPTTVAWSRHGEIAFTLFSSEPAAPNNPMGRGTEHWTLHVLDPASRRVERVGSAAIDDLSGSGPAWSPDGDRLVFRGRDRRIWLHDRTSGSTSLVAGGRRLGYGHVAWSPDGDRLLAFTRADGRGYALVSVPLDGSATERRTPWTWALDWITVEDVAWSPR